MLTIATIVVVNTIYIFFTEEPSYFEVITLTLLINIAVASARISDRLMKKEAL